MDFSPLFILHKIQLDLLSMPEHRKRAIYFTLAVYLDFTSHSKESAFFCFPTKIFFTRSSSMFFASSLCKGGGRKMVPLQYNTNWNCLSVVVDFYLSHKPQFPTQFPFMLFYTTPKSPLSQQNESQCS